MRRGYTLIEMLAVLVIMALGAAVAGASIAWPEGGPIAPADEYRMLLLRAQQVALASARRVTLLLERDGTYVLRRSSEHGEARIEAGRIESCSGTLEAVRSVRYVFDPRGLMNPGKIVAASRMDDRSLFRRIGRGEQRAVGFPH